VLTEVSGPAVLRPRAGDCGPPSLRKWSRRDPRCDASLRVRGRCPTASLRHYSPAPQCRWRQYPALRRVGRTAIGKPYAYAARLEGDVPEKKTQQRAARARRRGKAPTSQAGEFVREEVHHIREGKHGARSTKQAIAIGLSKARRSGVKLPQPPATAKATTKRSAQSATKAAKRRAAPSRRRSRAVATALKREGRGAASHRALSRQAKQAARRRSPAARRSAARKAARTKGSTARRQAAKKAARTRQKRQRRSA
jgi:hypothetical protein